jgi:hypothetical protein
VTNRRVGVVIARRSVWDYSKGKEIGVGGLVGRKSNSSRERFLHLSGYNPTTKKKELS